MVSRYTRLALVTGAVVFIGVSCVWQSGENYNIDKPSPSGIYRVKIKVWSEKSKDTTRGYTEHAKVEFLKGQEIIESYESKNPYRYEPTFRESFPIVEWVGDSVLRMGQDRSDQPFNDQIVLTNNTGQQIRSLGVSYGRFESFQIFDLASKDQVTLQASPRFKPDNTSNYFVGYGGVTQSGKEFEGVTEGTRRRSRADGPLKFDIVISDKELR